ncbi:MAG: hypothetical protein ACM37W_15835 [Actinomycetota bacterium]
MFGFIKNLFAGIFGFFGRLFSFKKSEYVLDLGGDQENQPAKAEPAVAKPLAVAAPAASEAATSGEAAPAQAEKPKAKKSSKSSAKAKPQPEPVKAPAASNGKVPTQVQPLLTFAPDYLVPASTSSRRLPGPSLNSFREMARQVKTK